MSTNDQSTALHYIGDELELFSRANNWKKYWSQKISALLGEKVLEIGAGIGTNLSLLYSPEKVWTSVEPDPIQYKEIESLVKEKYPTANTLTTIQGTIEDVSEDSFYDSVLYIDVLEHIKDDEEEIKRAIDTCKIGGKVIVVAPAHNFLYSPFDKAIGHFRRYNKSMLSKLTPANAGIVSHFYLDSVGCLASFCNATLLRSAMPNKKQILLWDKMMIPCSKVLDRVVNFKLGKTIVFVWQRKS